MMTGHLGACTYIKHDVHKANDYKKVDLKKNIVF